MLSKTNPPHQRPEESYERATGVAPRGLVQERPPNSGGSWKTKPQLANGWEGNAYNVQCNCTNIRITGIRIKQTDRESKVCEKYGENERILIKCILKWMGKMFLCLKRSKMRFPKIVKKVKSTKQILLTKRVVFFLGGRFKSRCKWAVPGREGTVLTCSNV